MSAVECAQLHSELFRRRHSTRQSHGLFALAKPLFLFLPSFFYVFNVSYFCLNVFYIYGQNCTDTVRFSMISHFPSDNYLRQEGYVFVSVRLSANAVTRKVFRRFSCHLVQLWTTDVTCVKNSLNLGLIRFKVADKQPFWIFDIKQTVTLCGHWPRGYAFR